MAKNSKRRPQGRKTKADSSTRAPVWERAFLATLRQTANVTVACENSDVSRAVVYARKEKDPAFLLAWNDALDEGADRLEQEAWRRAVDGVEKPVFQGGKLVGKVQEFSDTLMCLLLKGHKPAKFRERVTNEISGPNGSPLSVQVYLPANGR